MKTFLLKTSLQISLTIVALSLTGFSCPDVRAQQSQDGAPGGGRIERNPTPGHGTVAGKVLPFTFKGDDLQAAVMSHPMPETWLVFPASTVKDQPPEATSGNDAPTVKLELPVKAQQVLLSVWKAALNFRYSQHLENESSAQSDAYDGMALQSSRRIVEKDLQKIEIDTPTGRRTISWEEAEALTEFVSRAALDVIREAQRYKK